MDTQQNQLGFNNAGDIGSEAESNGVLTYCVWCGKLCSGREMVDGKCGFCSKFESKEEMEYMREVSKRLSILSVDVDKNKIWNEELEKFRKGNVMQFKG